MTSTWKSNFGAFRLDDAQLVAINLWAAEQDRKVIEEQKSRDDLPGYLTDNNTQPYYGAIGGELTYSFTPTSLGTVEKVFHSGTKQELDVTDYDSW